MDWLIALLLIGLLLIFLELFIPGGIVGILGAISLIASVVICYQLFNATIGTLYLIGLGIVLFVEIVFAIKYVPRTTFIKSISQRATQAGHTGTDETLQELPGKTGTAHTKLRPSGIATINNKRVNVVTEGPFLDKGTPIRVLCVEGNRVVVRKQEEEQNQH